MISILRIKNANRKIEELQAELNDYISIKERENEEFIQTKYIPYQTQGEQKKEELRRKMVTYEVAIRERDELPAKLKHEDQIRVLRSKHDAQMKVLAYQNDVLIRSIEKAHKKDQKEIKQQHIKIITDFAKQSPEMVRPLTDLCLVASPK
ncbi:MAG: hypothetical protein FWH27_13950 [Planctomycetaceae bacterium]|nr:hypothetical protein [Planctomycetaceae bacterium]